MDVLIDASRNRSGGAVAHILGILNSDIDPNIYGINKVYVCSYNRLLDRIEDKPWLIKVNHNYLEKNLIYQFLWQIFILPRFFRNRKIKVCLYTTAQAFLRIKNSIVMSRDMLSFEPGHIDLFPQLKVRIRLYLIGWLQVRSMRKARNVVFLTKYAQKVISDFTGHLDSVTVIPHGLNNSFRDVWIEKDKISNQISVIYISDAAEYKHHINVLKAVKYIRNIGYDIKLILIGANEGTASKNLQKTIKLQNAIKYVKTTGFLDAKEITKEIKKADLGLFASSCENMPNTLLEMMGSGIPIACSNRGPMLEVLETNDFTFNPFVVDEISNVLLEMINNYNKAKLHAKHCSQVSKKYSWLKCSQETFKNISEI